MATKKQLLTRVKAAKKRIATERDKLRDLIIDIESIHDDCDECVNDLESAADALSRLL